MNEIPKETRRNVGTALGRRKATSSTEMTGGKEKLGCRSGRKDRN